MQHEAWLEFVKPESALDLYPQYAVEIFERHIKEGRITDVERVREFQARGVLVDMVYVGRFGADHPLNALHCACEHHLVRTVRALLQAGADPNKRVPLEACMPGCETITPIESVLIGHNPNAFLDTERIESCVWALVEEGALIERATAKVAQEAVAKFRVPEEAWPHAAPWSAYLYDLSLKM